MMLPEIQRGAHIGQTQHNEPVASNFIQVTHILGFEDVPRNLTGELLIDDDYLHFQHDGSALDRVSIASIQSISLREQDKQVGAYR